MSVEKLSADFVSAWSDYLSINPCLELDGNWPSVNVIDLLTFSLRFKKEIPPQFDSIVVGSAAYLAQMAAKCWRPAVETIEIVNTEEGITLIAKGGSLIPQSDQVKVCVEKILRKRLRDLPSPFPVVAGFETPILFDSSIISLFAIGLNTGLIPGLTGPWENLAPEDLQPLIEHATKELSRQSAEHYARLYPREPLGQMPELYLNKLIYPPSTMEEDLPLLGVLPDFLSYFDDYGFGRESIVKLAHNLAQSLDPLMSNAGLAIYIALSDAYPPPAELLAAAQSKGTLFGFLRRAVQLIRSHYNLPKDWVESGVIDEASEKRFAFEHSFRLIPWLHLPLERVKEDAEKKELLPLIVALCDFDISEAKKLSKKLAEKYPGDIALRLQSIQLELLEGDFEKGDAQYQKLLSEPGADSDPRFFNYWGLCALQIKKEDIAARNFRAALQISNVDPELRSEIANNLAWALMTKGDFGRALDAINLGLETASLPLTLLLNKSNILWRLGRYEEVQIIRKKLFKLAPGDRRVFTSLTLTEGTLSQMLQ